jgi:hypothetical protein
MKWVSLGLVVLVAFVFSCAPTVMEGRKVDSAKLKEMRWARPTRRRSRSGNWPGGTVSPGSISILYLSDHGSEWYTIDNVQRQN